MLTKTEVNFPKAVLCVVYIYAYKDIVCTPFDILSIISLTL